MSNLLEVSKTGGVLKLATDVRLGAFRTDTLSKRGPVPSDETERQILDSFGRILTLRPEGRAAVTAAMLNATHALRLKAALRKNGDGGDGGDPGDGDPQPAPRPPSPPAPSPAPGPSPVPPAPPDVNPPTINVFWWGIQFVVEEPALKYVLSIDGIAGAVEGFLAAAAAAAPPADLIVGALALYFAVEAAVITAVDQGKGVYLSMTWIAPGLFLPTSIV